MKFRLHNGFAIAIAWPTTLCKQVGAWYDHLMNRVRISKNGYYKVGHSALLLVDQSTGYCRYFDFGRYHSPHGLGRVRSEKTDHDLKIKTKAVFSADFTKIQNLHTILEELFHNYSTHGSGTIYGSAVKINYDKALAHVNWLQAKEFIPYGPFLPKGTNCSRFVNSAILSGNPPLQVKLLLKSPPTLTPTPMWNVRAIGSAVILSKEGTCEYANQKAKKAKPLFTIKTMIYDRLTQNITRT